MEDYKKIYLGSDHAGFELKEKIKDFLESNEYNYEDIGSSKYAPGDDYPDYAVLVANKVSKTDDYGILVCASGVGMCITANKVKGIRAVNAYNVKIAQKSREHNNTNILCLGQDYTDIETAKEIIKVWLATDFSAAEKHHRRVSKISGFENEMI